MDDQEEKNQSESFIKNQTSQLKEKGKDAFKKNAKKKILQFLATHPGVAVALLVVLLVTIIVIVLLAGFYDIVKGANVEEASTAKSATITVSYNGQVSTNTNGEEYKIVVQPTEDKSSYEISHSYTDEELEYARTVVNVEIGEATDFTDFEIAILYALIENGFDIEDWDEEELHCFPAFIKAEACTQYLDLRSNNDKLDSKGNYKPVQLDDLDENEVPGVILVQRTNTNGDKKTVLEYKEKSEFDELVNNDDIDAINYFTVDDNGNIVFAKWKYIDINVTGTYPDEVSDEEREKTTQEYVITTEPIPYSQLITEFTMPFDLLVQLLVYTEDVDFCNDLVNVVLGSEIVINIQEEETYTYTVETYDYTVHNKDEKYVDYKISESYDIESDTEYFLNNATDDEGNDCTNYNSKDYQVIVYTQDTDHTYSWGLLKADYWLAKVEKTYDASTVTQDDTITSETETLGEYPEDGDITTLTDTNQIEQDADVANFISEQESYYNSKIDVPSITISSPKTETVVEEQSNNRFEEIIEDILSKTNENGKNDKDTKTVTKTYKTISATSHNGSGNANITTTLQDKYYMSESGSYNFPNQIKTTQNITTNLQKKSIALELIYSLNTNSYLGPIKDDICDCIVNTLTIKEYSKMDIKTNTTVDVTHYESDKNPTTNTHIYATESGTPGTGHGYSGFEKFLVAYDNNEDARYAIDTGMDEWLFEAMEENENTVELVDTVKYLLYMYNGHDYGVPELEIELDDVFDEINMNTFNVTIYGDSIEEKVWFALKDAGFSEIAVAAVMGNIYKESGFNATSINSSSGASGLCQWLGGRYDQLKAYAKSKGTDWTDEDTQIEFLIGEITKGGTSYATFQMGGTYNGCTYSSWKDATVISEATKAFRKVFERCGESEADDETRINKANEYYNQFQGKERSGGSYTDATSEGSIIGTYTSTITGKTFTIFNQNSSGNGLASSRTASWSGWCNRCVAATIATGYNGGDINDVLSNAEKWSGLMYQMNNSNYYFSKYGLKAKIGTYSVSNIRSALTSGKYIGIRCTSYSYGKSGSDRGGSSGHWVAILGYKVENNSEFIFIADSALGNTGWYTIEEFESCKNSVDNFTVVSPN